jgi:uncharacterized damage-inducible protein DinB
VNPQSPYFDLASHTIWADRQLITFCRTLDDATLNAVTGGTYGSILETFRHFIASDVSYLTRYLTGERPAPWDGYDTAGLDELSARIDELETLWTAILDNPPDNEDLGEARGGGDVFDVKKGVFLTQAIHHANEHRAQICSSLGLLGIEPPEISAWLYAIESGRSTLVTGSGDAS